VTSVSYGPGRLRAVSRGARPRVAGSVLRPTLLLLGVLLSAWAGLGLVSGSSLVPMIWAPAGIGAALFLTTTQRWRALVLSLIFVSVLAAHLVQHYDPVVALGFSLSCVAAVWTVRTLLVRGLEGRVALLDQGDVSRLIGAIAVSAAVAAAGCALTDRLTGHGNPLLGALAAFGAYASSMMVVLPLCLRTIEFEPLAGRVERIVQPVILVGTTMLVFWPSSAPPVVFAVMPMFAWYAYRGGMREATLLLTVVTVIGTAFTVAGLGPIYGLGDRYDVAPEVVGAVLQLFVLDCALILLPLAVMTTQQRMSAGRADSEGEALRQLVAAATGTAIMATGRDGRVEVFNPAAEQMFGWSAGDVLGRLPEMLVPDHELASQAAYLHAQPIFADICRATVQRGGGSRSWSFERQDGEMRTMRMSIAALTDELGARRGYLATAEDVTEREAANRALLSSLEHQRVAMDRLQELERVKTDFVATVSHELRTPITSIVGYAEVLEDGMVGSLTPDQHDIVGRVERNGHRLLRLVEDLLTLSQIESSGIRMHLETTDFADVVRLAREDMVPALAERELSMTLELPPAPVVLDGDALHLQRMVVHLLTNSVKFTPDGGEILISVSAQEDTAVLVVSDSGIGICPEEQARLFTRFFRSRTATDRAIQGVGLGLTIVQSIIALHGGTIEVSSALDEGTTVTVKLPRVAIRAEDNTVPAA
jgi:PAS domain S-box-containing protein